MKRSRLLLCILLWPGLACAQFTADYQTNIISGVVSNWSGSYIVGSNTSYDALFIQESGILSNQYTYIGRESTGQNNSVTVTGTNSMLKSDWSVFVGYFGSSNSLTVNDGAKVGSGYGSAGEYGANNNILMSGTGTVWQCDVFDIGGEGSGNGLIVRDGAMLIGRNGNIGEFGGSSNFVLVTGGGSIWSNTVNCWVGPSGSGNSLVISNGGMVADPQGYLGFSAVDSNNTVIVTGNGSTWRNQGDLSVLGGGNKLRIDDGGFVIASNVYISTSNSGHDGNVVNVLNGSLYVTNGVISVGHGGVGEMTISNGTVAAQSLTVGNLNGSRGTLTVDGGTLNVSSDWMTVGSLGSGDLVVSNGSVSLSSLRVAGKVGSAGTLHVHGGSLNVANQLVFGQEAGPTATVWVTGGELLALTNSNSELHVGNWCEAQITISNGTFKTWRLRLGNGNIGTLTVAGGHLDLLTVAELIGTNSTLWVKGGQMTGGALYVGGGASASVSLSNGFVQIPLVRIGWQAGAAGIMTVAGGTVDFNSPFPQFPQIISEFHIGGRASVTGVVWVTGGQIIGKNALYVGGTNDLGFFPPNQSGYGQMAISNGAVTVGELMVGALPREIGRLDIAGGVVAAGAASVGTSTCDGTGTISVAAGNFFVTNLIHDAVLEVRSGTFTESAGSVVIDKLVVTNACGHFIHSGGNLVVGSLVLATNTDADGDGIPNGWEQAHGLDPLTPNADDDPDGDGLSNAQEFSLGTDPSNSSSPFRITSLTREGADIRLTWQTIGGKTNLVQATSNLASNFIDISSTIAIVGVGVSSTNYIDFGAATNFPLRFYRIRIVP